MRRYIAKIVVMASACFVLLLGVLIAAAFLSFALYSYLLTWLTPAAAAAATGLGVFAVCALVALCLRGFEARAPGKKPANAEMLKSVEEFLLAQGVSTVMARKLRAMGAQHPFALTVGFAAAGLVLGWSPRLRAFLRDLV
jgi:hypothetical protein